MLMLVGVESNVTGTSLVCMDAVFPAVSCAIQHIVLGCVTITGVCMLLAYVLLCVTVHVFPCVTVFIQYWSRHPLLSLHVIVISVIPMLCW